MWVRVTRPQVVGPVNSYDEAWVVADMGAGATGMNTHGGITLRRTHGCTDWNPERIRLRFPRSHGRQYRLDTGTRLADVKGVISYSYGNYVLLAKGPPRVLSSPLRRETSALRHGAHALTIATYNVQNLVRTNAPDSAPWPARSPPHCTHRISWPCRKFRMTAALRTMDRPVQSAPSTTWRKPYIVQATPPTEPLKSIRRTIATAMNRAAIYAQPYSTTRAAWLWHHQRSAIAMPPSLWG